MPPKRRVAATKLRWAKAREERDKQEPAVEPEVELEEPEEEPTELEPFFPFRVRGARHSKLWMAMADAFRDWKCLAAL